MNTNLNIQAIEELLKKGVQGGQLNFALTDDDIDFLFANFEAVRPSKDLTKVLEQILVNAIRERESFELSELRKSTTFGEYFTRLKDKVNLLLGFGSIRDFLPASISPEKLISLERDQIGKLTAAEIAEVIIRFAIPFKEALRLLENSFRLDNLKSKRLLSSSLARVSEKPNTEARAKTRTSSMQKLLLAVDSEKQLTSIDKDWSNFRSDLEAELEKAGYISGESKHA
jgi:hypothetical protein